MLVPFALYFPALIRLAPWAAAVPAVLATALILLTTLPLVTWVILCVAVLAPLAAGAALLNFGWE